MWKTLNLLPFKMHCKLLKKLDFIHGHYFMKSHIRLGGLGLGKVAGPQGVDQGRVPDVCRMLQCLTPLCHWAVRGYSDCFPKHFIISSPINPAEPGTRQYSVSWCELISYPHSDWQRTEVPVNPAMRREGSCPLNYFARIGPFHSPKPLQVWQPCHSLRHTHEHVCPSADIKYQFWFEWTKI